MHTTTLLLLLLGTLLNPALTYAYNRAQSQELISVWASLDHDSPEYQKCLVTECVDYLQIHSVCEALKNGGNYTSDPKLEKEIYLRCVCIEEVGFLVALKKCEKCTGESTYPKMKTECDKRTGTTTSPPTNTNTPPPETSSTTSASPTSTETETSQPSATSDSPQETPTDTDDDNQDDGSGGVRNLQLGSWMGVGYILVVGVVAVLAGVV